MEYSVYDVVQDLKKLYIGPKSRKRVLIERRSYLIGVLYYKFKLTELQIQSFTNLVSRSTINYAKKYAVELYNNNDTAFLNNVSDLIKKYPYDMAEYCPKVKHFKNSTVNITITLNYKNYARLNNYKKAKNIKEDYIAVQQLLLNTLRLWEE